MRVTAHPFLAAAALRAMGTPVEVPESQGMTSEDQTRSNGRHRSGGAPTVATSKRDRVPEANEDTGSHGPLPNPAKKARFRSSLAFSEPRYGRSLNVEEGERTEEETLVNTPSQRTLPPIQFNPPEPQNAEGHNAPARTIISISDGDLNQLFGYCAQCSAGGEAVDWHLEAHGFPCRRQELKDAFRTANASGVVKSLHRFMGESLRPGHGRHGGIKTHTSIWIEEYRGRLLPWVDKLINMDTYDCLSLAYRLLWKLKDLPQEPYLDEVRKARSEAGDVTSTLMLPQDIAIDIMMRSIIQRRAMKGEKWAWEHDLAALKKQASLLMEPAFTEWFIGSRDALSHLGKQREGLTSEFLDQLPGFQYAMALNVGSLGLRKGVHCASCADKVDQLDHD